MTARWAAARIPVQVLVLGLLVAGCSGSDEPGADAASATPTEEATSESTPTVTDDPAPDYVPVPSGITLDEPGSRLDLKDVAVAGWTPRQDLVGVVEVAVTRLEATTVKAALAGYELDDQARSATPYYVHTLVTNVGDTDLGGRQLPFYAISSDGSLVAPTGIEQDFAECPGSLLPAIFAPGDEASSCLIFLVPEGGSLESVMFRPPEGVVPLTWSGEVKAVKTPGATGEKKGRKGRRS